MDIFTNNLNIRDELVELMKGAAEINEYKIYKKLYDSLMVIDLNLNHFKNPETNDFYRDGDGDNTYTEYFRNEVPEFYNELMNIFLIEDEEEKKQKISNTIDNIVLSIENVINVD